MISGFPALKIGDEKEPNALKTTDVHSRPYEPIRTFSLEREREVAIGDGLSFFFLPMFPALRDHALGYLSAVQVAWIKTPAYYIAKFPEYFLSYSPHEAFSPASDRIISSLFSFSIYIGNGS